MSESIAIDIQSVSKSFGSNRVLDNVTLRVPRGETFAFLGRNGQGKSTTIRMLLGLLDPDGGTLSVDGLDPRQDALAIRRRVGYLAEDQRMFGWMTVAELIRFTRAFYPTWDDAHAERLRADFELPPKTRIRHLSKGQNVRLGLLLALAHRPGIVILDDPTLGLDPIMRKEFMRDVIDHLQGNGVTVFFSSHLLYEIEPVADRVAILDRGRIARVERTETLREEVRQFVVSAEDAAGAVRGLPGVLDIKPSHRRVAVVVDGAAAARQFLREKGIEFEEIGLSLDEIFEACVVGKKEWPEGEAKLVETMT